MKKISIDNGNSWTTPEAAIATLGLDAIVNYMDDDIREATHNALHLARRLSFWRLTWRGQPTT